MRESDLQRGSVADISYKCDYIAQSPPPQKKTTKEMHVGFEVFTAVTMKNAIFWDVVLCGFIINRRVLGGKCHQ
jgi:hypothetical protein